VIAASVLVSVWKVMGPGTDVNARARDVDCFGACSYVRRRGGMSIVEESTKEMDA
jgi:hypothetical protein